MTGPIDERIGTFGELFRQIGDPPGVALTEAVQIADGPLSRGLGSVHNERSSTGSAFADEMRRGMTKTGDILVGVSADYGNIDKGGANGIRKLFE